MTKQTARVGSMEAPSRAKESIGGAVYGLRRQNWSELLLPPHSDNEHAAYYLRTQVGQNHPAIEWAAVRPDSLVDSSDVTDYEIHPSPTRSAIFNAGETSRINVADLMARLITEEDLWEQWKGQMPVIYNQI